MKIPNERFLLTWNKNKHPEVVEFFNSIEQGLYSHYVREAIKYYLENKLKPQETSNVKQNISENQETDDNEYLDFDATSNVKQNISENQETDDNEYLDFDADEI